MALWITKQRGTNGPVFGSADNFDGLAIFFDTYKNNRPGVIFPYVMAMMGMVAPTYAFYTNYGYIYNLMC